MTDISTPSPGTDIYSPVPGASVDLSMTPGQQARHQIEAMKRDPEIAKRWADGDPAILAKVKGLHEQEHQHEPGVISGAPTTAEQLNTQANVLADAGLPSDVVEHFRNGGTVSIREYRQAVPMWNSKKADPEWRAKLERGDHQATQELKLMQVIRSSRVVA